jgi:hypothetical protein
VFYFEQLFQTALGGIDTANVTGAVLGVAGTILLLSFLYSAYQAFAAGGDVRMLAISGIKYLIVGLVFANYGAVFREVNSMFNSLANFIYSSTGVGDVFANWMNELSQYWQSNGSTSLWNLVTGLASGVISLWLILGAFVIFPVCYLIFTVFYAMYGSVLYVTGPFILAVLPARGLSQLSRTYLINLMTFQAWGLIYAVIQVLMSAVNLASINAVLGANGVLNSFVGSSEMILLALTASIFSLSIALIPFIASRIVRGDIGSTTLTLMRTLSATAGVMAGFAATSFVAVGDGAVASRAAAEGGTAPPPPPRDGASRSSGGHGSSALNASLPPSPPPGSSAGSAGRTGFSNAVPSAIAAAYSEPSFTRPSRSSTGPGQHGALRITDAMAWYVGYSLGSAYRGTARKE